MANPLPDTDVGEMSRPMLVAFAKRTIPKTPTRVPANINGLLLPNLDMHLSLKTKGGEDKTRAEEKPERAELRTSYDGLKEATNRTYDFNGN